MIQVDRIESRVVKNVFTFTLSQAKKTQGKEIETRRKFGRGGSKGEEESREWRGIAITIKKRTWKRASTERNG